MFYQLYTGTDGESHFEDVTMPPTEERETAPQPVSEITFRRSPPGTKSDWHNAPQRQYVITLAGRAEFIVGDGSSRTVVPGDVLLCEDVDGQGHYHRVMGDETRIVAFVPVT